MENEIKCRCVRCGVLMDSGLYCSDECEAIVIVPRPTKVRYKGKAKRKLSMFEKAKDAGMSYGEYQRMNTLSMIPRIDTDIKRGKDD